MGSKKYSKSELKARRLFKTLAIIVIVLVIATVCFFTFVVFKNNIVKERIDYSATNASDDMVKNATPVILNNVVLGAVYNKTWIASESYYFRNENKIVDVDVYNEEGKKGKYKINDYTNADSTGAFYVNINKPNTSEEFLAIGSSDTNVMTHPSTRQMTVTDEDIEVVKKALGKYMLFNTTVKISSVHNITLDSENKGRIICATNEVGKSSGAYSAVIYQKNTGETEIIKYNYIKDLNNASNWPIYSFKFAADLNLDGINDIILQETKEFEVKYDVIEYKNNKFTEVLSTNIKI